MPKKPPKYGEEVHRIAQAGLDNHRSKGNVTDLTAPIAGADKQRFGTRKKKIAFNKGFNDLSVMAVYAMAHGDFAEWNGALEELRSLLRKHDYQPGTFIAVCKQIEDDAVEASGNPFCGSNARHWLLHERERLFFGPPRP